MNIPLPAAQRLVVNTFDVGFPDYSTLGKKIRHFFCAARPRAEGAGPAPLVLFRPPGAFGCQAAGAKPAPCLPPALRQPCGLPSWLREPTASKGLRFWPRLVSLRGSGSRHALASASRLSPFACCGTATRFLACRRAGHGRPGSLPASRLRRLALAPRSPAASLGLTARSAAVSAGILFVIPAKAGIRGLRFASLYHSRNSVSPSMFKIGERCHSDGVLPASARQNDSLSRTGGREGISARIGQ